jgi:hypothetical protein
MYLFCLPSQVKDMKEGPPAVPIGKTTPSVPKHVPPCNTLIFKKIKICQANAFQLNNNRKILNNLINCISWHAYFYF